MVHWLIHLLLLICMSLLVLCYWKSAQALYCVAVLHRHRQPLKQESRLPGVTCNQRGATAQLSYKAEAFLIPGPQGFHRYWYKAVCGCQCCILLMLESRCLQCCCSCRSAGGTDGCVCH